MDPWKRRIWATAGAVLVILTVAAAGAWYLAIVTSGSKSATDAVNPVLVACGAIVVLGTYMCVAAMCDWPLPGRTRQRSNRAELERLERIKNERVVRRNERLARLVADGERIERSYLGSSGESADASLLVGWSDDARSFVSGIDVKLLPAFDHQRPPAEFRLEGRSSQLAEIVGLLRVRIEFLSRLKSSR